MWNLPKSTPQKKMSFIYKEVEDSEILRRNNCSGRFIEVSIDPSSINQLDLPKDYEFSSSIQLKKFKLWSDRIQNFEIRENDIWIIGYLKTGTTWMHNIAWQLKNNLDFSVPAKKSNDEYFEAPIIFDKKDGDEKLNALVDELDGQFNLLDKLPSPRIIKSHLPAYLLPKQIFGPKKPSLIYVTRNPKDVTNSLFHMMANNMTPFHGNLEDMVESVIGNCRLFLPFHGHVLSFWQLRHLDHVLFTTYEELSADLFGQVKRVAKFLGCSYSDDQLEQLTKYVSFGNMRKQNLNDYVGEKRDPNYRYRTIGFMGTSSYFEINFSPFQALSQRKGWRLSRRNVT